MAQATAQVIIPRRNFLIRALGFTAAGATLTLPIVSIDGARARAEHHARELKAALGDLYPNLSFVMADTLPAEWHGSKWALQGAGEDKRDAPMVLFWPREPGDPRAARC